MPHLMSPDDLIPLPAVRSWVGLDPDETGHDEVLRILLDAAWDTVRGETDRYFGPVKVTTEILHGNGTGSLTLSERPANVEAVEVVVVETILIPSDTVSPLHPNTYVVEDRVLRRTDGGVFRASHQARGLGWARTTWPGELAVEGVKVTYPVGYTPETLPGDIKMLVLNLVRLRYGRRAARLDLTGVSSKQVGDLRLTFTEGSDAADASDVDLIDGGRRTIERWRRRRW